MERKRKGLIIYISIVVLVVGLNVLAWSSTAFCDAYITWVFPLWVNTYGRVTGMFPFSVGEIMLFLAVLLVMLSVLLGMVSIVIFLARLILRRSKGTDLTGTPLKSKANGWSYTETQAEQDRSDKSTQDRTKTDSSFMRFVKRYYLFMAWTLLIVALVMTLNCFILYHASTFSSHYFENVDEDYTLEELLVVRNFVVAQCNQLAGEMQRDEDGTIIFDKDMEDIAIKSMKLLGREYKQLDGYYPRPKPLYTSDFFCQQYMCGYYFPFSMEANYNDVMYIMNKPSTMCHELAHLRGYIFEDEANFISFLACIGSDDKTFIYSGYLSVLNYLDNDFYRAVSKDWEEYLAQPGITQQVIEDNVFVTDEEWERINGKALLDTELVDEVTDVLVDTSLKVNGVADGKISYSRVVRLLLQYYKETGLL